MSELEVFLRNRQPRDQARLIENLYRFLPRPAARLGERYLTPRHMRSMAPRVSFVDQEDLSWDVRLGTSTIARSRPLTDLVGRIDKPVTIVATGPSAREHAWDEARDGGRFVIAVAGAPTLLKEAGVKPDLLVVSDSRFARYGIEHIRTARGVPMVTVLRAISFLAESSAGELTSRPFAAIEKINSWYGVPRLPVTELEALNQRSGNPFAFPDPLDTDFRIGWSHAPELGFFSGSTVPFVALQIAVRLGAKDIEIVGMDLSSAGRAYAEGDKAVRNTLAANYDEAILPAFRMMHQSLLGSGVSVKNRSAVCPLPASLFG